jgi:hypothetical protein
MPLFMLALGVFACTARVAAEDVFLPPDDFIAQAFDGAPPAPRKLWITPELDARIRAILGASLPGLRQKYWRQGSRSAWVLEAIGRDRPITAGFVVDNGQLARTAILIYRESRGAEVRYPFFTEQFAGATLAAEDALDRPIDGITGATLSVRAITGLSRVALLLDAASSAQ